MNKNVLDTDLSGKVAVVTGAGGVLCSAFAKTLARAGAKVALLDLNEEAAQSFADEITAEGGVAKAYKCNVLDKAVCYEVADAVEKDFGKCDILVNGAGGNNPRATTDKEYFEEHVRKIIETREWAKEELHRLGFEFPDAKANFIFATHPQTDAGRLFEALKANDIYVRHWDSERIGQYLRITVGTREEMQVLFDFLTKYIKGE